jgi:hypothetical protein
MGTVSYDVTGEVVVVTGAGRGLGPGHRADLRRRRDGAGMDGHGSVDPLDFA